MDFEIEGVTPVRFLIKMDEEGVIKFHNLPWTTKSKTGVAAYIAGDHILRTFNLALKKRAEIELPRLTTDEAEELVEAGWRLLPLQPSTQFRLQFMEVLSKKEWPFEEVAIKSNMPLMEVERLLDMGGGDLEVTTMTVLAKSMELGIFISNRNLHVIDLDETKED